MRKKLNSLQTHTIKPHHTLLEPLPRPAIIQNAYTSVNPISSIPNQHQNLSKKIGFRTQANSFFDPYATPSEPASNVEYPLPENPTSILNPAQISIPKMTTPGFNTPNGEYFFIKQI